MTVDALLISITEESHQSVMVGELRFDFIFNSLIDRWFLTIFKNDVLIYGSKKIVRDTDLLRGLNVGEMVIIHDEEISREELIKASIIYIKGESNVL